MPTQILPAASLSSAHCLPAARTLSSVSNYLICMALWSIARAVFRVASIVPELATEWSWSEDGTQLSFPLRKGVKWHDGKPFTAQDVKCTWEALLGVSADKFRINPRRAWYRNVEKIITNGDYEVTFQL